MKDKEDYSPHDWTKSTAFDVKESFDIIGFEVW